MGSLHTLTNNYLDVEVWDIDPTQGRGPFIVVQAGCAPGDERAQEKFFLLRRDGQWVDVAYYLTHSEPSGLDEAVFDTTSEVMQVLGDLGHLAKVFRAEISQEQLLAWYRANPGVSPGLPGLQKWVAGYRERKRAQQNERKS